MPAFNINNMQQALAVMTAANEVDAPVIIQASRGARTYANDVMLKHTAGQASKIKRIATLAEVTGRYKKGELVPKFA